jgi:molybdate transport system ATP-binding protein
MTGQIDAAFEGALGDFRLDTAFTAAMTGVTALFGPSGSGKTTVLRCIAGLTRMQGRLSVNGRDWQSAEAFTPAHQRPVGYVFQDANLFPQLTVTGNLNFAAKRSGKRSNGDSPAIDFDETIDLLGLAPLMQRMPAALSGGERQRVAVGRALLSRPQVLLMDEPLSGLDQAAKADILPYLERLTDTLAIPVLYVSHDIGEVARLADHMVLLNSGRAIASGTIGDMLERLDLGPLVEPFEESVLATAEVTGHDPKYRLTRLICCGQPLTIPEADLAIGETVRLRIRARDVALATKRPEGISIRNILEGHIAEISAAPGAAHAETLVDINGARLRARITLEALAELELTVGAPVFALVKSVTFDGRSIAQKQSG